MKPTLSWKLVAITSVAQGIIFYANPRGAMFPGICLGIYFTIRLWLVDHPLTAYYDIRLFAVLLAVGALSGIVSTLLCWGISYGPIRHDTCQEYTIWETLRIQVFSLMALSSLLWGFVRIRIWLALR